MSSFALIAGTFAAGASFFGKLAVDGYLLPSLTSSGPLLLILRVASFATVFVMNALMWAFFTKALSLSTTSVQATVVNVVSNFLTTALLGVLVFKETLTPSWWLGAGLILTGTILLNKQQL